MSSDINASIRHYSALRFAMLSVFFAVVAALINAKFSSTLIINKEVIQLPCLGEFYLINFIGIWLSVVFLIFEIAIDIRLHGLWNQLSIDEKNTTSRNVALLWLVRLSALSIPAGSLIMWLTIKTG